MLAGTQFHIDVARVETPTRLLVSAIEIKDTKHCIIINLVQFLQVVGGGSFQNQFLTEMIKGTPETLEDGLKII
jgi:hypothetical protein